jgi:hypothetical protein
MVEMIHHGLTLFMNPHGNAFARVEWFLGRFVFDKFNLYSQLAL